MMAFCNDTGMTDPTLLVGMTTAREPFTKGFRKAVNVCCRLGGTAVLPAPAAAVLPNAACSLFSKAGGSSMRSALLSSALMAGARAGRDTCCRAGGDGLAGWLLAAAEALTAARAASAAAAVGHCGCRAFTWPAS